MYSSTLSRTSALDGGVSPAPRPPLPPGKDPLPILQEAERATGPVCMGGKALPHRDSIRTVQPVVSPYTDWATRPTFPEVMIRFLIFFGTLTPRFPKKASTRRQSHIRLVTCYLSRVLKPLVTPEFLGEASMQMRSECPTLLRKCIWCLLDRASL